MARLYRACGAASVGHDTDNSIVMAKLLDERVRVVSSWPDAVDAAAQVFVCYPLRQTSAPDGQRGKHNGKSFGDKRCRGSRKWTSNEPVPWPNTYWLACPETVRRVGRLEHMGYVRRYQAEIEASPEYQREFEANHRAYAAARWALLSDEDRAFCEQKGFAAVLRDTGVGGIRCSSQVRCLHVHTAHALATGGNLVGRWVLEALRRGEDALASEYQLFRGPGAAAAPLRDGAERACSACATPPRGASSQLGWRHWLRTRCVPPCLYVLSVADTVCVSSVL